jgi:serine/threonine-protein kinase SRPK3
LADCVKVFQLSNPPKTTVTPAGLRALELILETNFNESVDIWSSGCLVFEFVIGIPLFTVSHWSGSEQDQTDDDHLLRMSDIFGPLPEELFSKWTRADRYFGPDRERINSIVDGSTSEDPPSLFDSLENRFDKSKPADMGEEDAASAISLIRTILQYVPSQRPSVNDLLRHPWLMEQ